MGELFSVYAKTDGSSTTGTCNLYSDLFYGTTPPTYIRIPKGMKLKIWAKRIYGAVATQFNIQYTHDVTAASPSYIDVEIENLASAGEMSLEKRRPIILRGFTGKEAIKVTWTQSTAGNAAIHLDIEISE